MSNTAIEFENISKQYRLGVVGTGTISHDLNRWWHKVRGKEDPYLKIGEVNDRSSRATSEYVWALRDITFNVNQGDVLGIIGKNGAGKSTLLKILSRVTSPTTGSIKARGRIASLLEVGTGFHPEMTGRENIYMNGAIMGMTKAEITRKLDEIVDFAGIEKYIDTPVKRYSSGMTVRLGFAVAAHLEPEILVVDEVLAVGDAEFQKKAIGKMQNVSRGEGRTVLFVSHNLDAVGELCHNCVLLSNGQVELTGTTEYILNEYRKMSTLNEAGEIMKKTQGFEFLGFKNETELRTLKIDNDIDLDIMLRSDKDMDNVFVDIGIYNQSELMVAHAKAKFISDEGISIKKNVDNQIRYHIKSPRLAPGDYYVTLYIYDKDNVIYWHELIPGMTIKSSNIYNSSTVLYLDDLKGVVIPSYSIQKIDK